MFKLCLILSTTLFKLFFVHGDSSYTFTKWTLTNSNEKIKIQNVSSPIDVYTALYQHSIIDWPLKGHNDVKYRWIAYENWTFTSDPFSIEPFKTYSLHISGLDIKPFISINDQLIRTTSSEFLSDDVPINPSILYETKNILQLQFVSPIVLANFSAANNNYKVPPDCWPEEFHGECHINFLRKTQASFGWDWGPAIPTVGIRGKILLQSTNTTMAKIKSIKLITKTDSNCSSWTAEVRVLVVVVLGVPGSTICNKIKIVNLMIENELCLVATQTEKIEFRFQLNIDNGLLKLWWPHDMGHQVLYRIESYVLTLSKLLDFQEKYVGFRYISLNQTILPNNNNGRYFGFFINCRSFFIKGTNWVPRTYLTYNWNNESFIEFLLHSVKIANMNSIRLWGGGKPEHEHFYSVADRLGLMIWHDLMFACALYPNNKDYNIIAYKEVSEIVSKLQYHPSILVWSGNNEIEVLIAQGWYNTPKMDPKNIDDYYNLFANFIRNAVQNEDPLTPFILSSPSNGIESEKTKGVSTDPQNPYFGDVHFYLYSGDLWNEASYPITRMTTEFGFQSLPKMETWKHMTLSNNDFEIQGPLMKHLQHHPNGNDELISAIKLYFGKLYPMDTTSISDKYKWFSYLSQINQANILKVHINKLLSSQCILTSDGKGMTRGAMYWQLNDNWIAPTWSTIDYLGNWKLAHYYVQKSFAQERVNIVVIKGFVTVTVILPTYIQLTRYDILIISKDFTRTIPSSTMGYKNISVDANKFRCNVQTVLSMEITEFMKQMKCPYKNSCLFDVILSKNKIVVSTDSLFLVYPLNMKVPKEVANDLIKINISQNHDSPEMCLITLESKYIHFYTFLTTSSWGIFSDNGFHISENKTSIQFVPWYMSHKDFFNCSLLQVEVLSLNKMFN